MDVCPNCGMGASGVDFCPECGVKVSPRGHDDEGPGQDRILQAKIVYLAPDELAAATVQKVLESDGIESWIQSSQAPGFEALLGLIEGYWGRVLVFEDQEEAARTAIEGYLRTAGLGAH
jgi:hypothetical protein